MAIIYGRAEAEKDLLSISPNSVKKVEDLETVHQELKDKLSNNKKKFFSSEFVQLKLELEDLKQYLRTQSIQIPQNLFYFQFR